MMNELSCAETVMPFRRRVRCAWTTAALVEILAAGFVVCVAGSFFIAPHTMCIFGESKGDIAKFETQKLANEAYPQWAYFNRPRTCPSSLAELFAYDDTKHAWDPWGSAYSFDCVGLRIIVRSPGEDREYGTADDIRSDQ